MSKKSALMFWKILSTRSGHFGNFGNLGVFGNFGLFGSFGFLGIDFQEG